MASYTAKVKDLLAKVGCNFVRHGKGDHDIWRSPINNATFPVDGNIKSRHTANKTLKDAGLPKAF